MLRTDDFDYSLPEALIAQTPARGRGESRLLVLTHSGHTDSWFSEFPRWVAPGDLLVMNDTRVMKARLFGHKDSGGKVECLVERVLSPTEALVHFRASHAPRPGGAIDFPDGVRLLVESRSDDLFQVRLQNTALNLWEWMDRSGELPLPPYIHHSPDSTDEERYQTVYARAIGAIAAPTAGLHFDAAMLDRLAADGIERATVTLHVGAGTFQPVRAEYVKDHVMHQEWFDIPPATVKAIELTRARGGRVIAVGTTSLRALEAAATEGTVRAGPGETRLFITPGYRFQVVDRLLTNFHLPRSTLLMLVSAFAGREAILSAYRHAVEQGYRFFSYGDAMLIDRMDTP